MNERDDDDDRGMLEEQVCWKCKGYGKKLVKNHPLKKPKSNDNNNEQQQHRYVGSQCTECKGSGKRKVASKKCQISSQQPGIIPKLRGKNGIFAGTPAATKFDVDDVDDDDISRIVNTGEILMSLGCGDWRIFQLVNGHKLTVDDFICAYVASTEMRKRGYGVPTGRFGQQLLLSSSPPTKKRIFKHADIGCGCGSVLMTLLWAFPNSIRSYGVEAQQVSYDLCRRGIQWNLGIDVTTSTTSSTTSIIDDDDDNDITITTQDDLATLPIVQLTHQDLRSWSGGNLKPYDLITGTPPYFPIERFISSPNHAQKIRCRIPTRGAASDYIETAARLISPNGIICIVETARKEAELAVLETIQKVNLSIIRRLDVITKTGLPPRFSCWVLTPLQSSSSASNDNKKGIYQDNSPPPSSNNETAAPDSAGTDGRKASNDDGIIRGVSSTSLPPLSFPIETLTIRNKDQSRTIEYVDALDIMGWVDFEQTKEKFQQKQDQQQ